MKKVTDNSKVITYITNRILMMIMALAVIVTPVSLLAGCANPLNKQAQSDDEDESDDEDDDGEDESTQEESDSDDDADDAAEIVEREIPDIAVSSNVWDLGDRTIVFGRDRIYSYDHKKGRSKLIWKDMKKGDGNSYSESSVFSAGTGIVIGDKIYFTRSDNSYDANGDWKTRIELYRIDLDGKGQKSLFVLDGVTSYDQDLAYEDGILYMVYSSTDYPECFKLDEAGDIVENFEASELPGYDYDPSEMVIQSIMQNGYKYLLPNITAAQCGKKIFSKNYNTLVVEDASTGECTEYKDQYAVSMYKDKLLLYHYNSGSNNNNYDYGILDLTNGKYKKILSNEYNLRIFSMDDKYVYYGEPGGRHPARDYSYLKCDIGTGEVTSLYTFKTEKSELPDFSEWDIVSAYSDGILYTALNRDYKLSFVGIEPESGDMDVLVKEYYDPGIYDTGVLVYKDDAASHNGTEVVSASISVLQLDDKFPGAAKINKVLMDDANNVLANVDDCYDECVQWYEESGGDYFIPYEFTADFGYISYNDGKIINIVQEGYDYYGGAHGMPYWVSYVFDLNTGERLYLSDLIDISEEQIDDLLVEYATKHMNDIGESYWDGYEETVKQYGGFDSDSFILMDDGIDFFYAPYLLTSFAGGFQDIIVPYEKLNPKFR